MRRLRPITRDRMLQEAEDEIESLILGGIDVWRMYRNTPDGPVQVTDEDDFVLAYAADRTLEIYGRELPE